MLKFTVSNNIKLFILSNKLNTFMVNGYKNKTDHTYSNLISFFLKFSNKTTTFNINMTILKYNSKYYIVYK